MLLVVSDITSLKVCYYNNQSDTIFHKVPIVKHVYIIELI